tara:strand:+ start:690 stop:863 length:174 start_codon:yes stop_codon:yes gene_type:complete
MNRYKLPTNKQFKAFILKVYGLTEEEIAKHENVSRRAIRARLFLLKKKMPKLFNIWK